jgi:hypothetical protein
MFQEARAVPNLLLTAVLLQRQYIIHRTALVGTATSDGTQGVSTTFTHASTSRFLLLKILDKRTTHKAFSRLWDTVQRETSLWKVRCVRKTKLVPSTRDKLRWQENYQSRSDSTNFPILLLTLLNKLTKFQECLRGNPICFQSCAEFNKLEAEALSRVNHQVKQRNIGLRISGGSPLFSATAKRTFKMNLLHIVLLRISELIVTLIGQSLILPGYHNCSPLCFDDCFLTY